MPSSFAVILPAAGKSSRFNDPNLKKPFVTLDGRPVWMHSAERFSARDDVKQILIVIAAEDEGEFKAKFGANLALLGIEVVIGGAERTDSVAAAIAKVRDDIDFVAIHDAARPCIADDWIDRVFREAEKSGAAILANPVTATLKRVGSTRHISETVSREGLWEAQTPQVFARKLLVDAYARRTGKTATDDAQLVEQLVEASGKRVSVVQGSPMNIKITTKEDLKIAGALLKALPKPKGMGPTHPFAGDDLWR
jgi:2-C-methyl-D-erythritol 4-phosphate cytidylyltransferase